MFMVVSDGALTSDLAGHRFETSWFWRLLPAGMRRRWWLFRLFDIIARHWPVLGKPKGTLIVRMDGIGDMVLFRRALDDYAHVLDISKSDITVLGCKSWGPISKEIFQGYSLIMIDEHAFARQPFYRFKIGLMVRRLNAARALNDSYFRRAMMADSLVWLSGAPETIVSLPFINEPTRTEFTYYLSQVGRIIDTGPYPTHEIIRHYRFLEALASNQMTPQPPSIPWRNTETRTVGERPYVVLNPGSNEYGRRWPFENYVEVGKRILNRGFRVVIVGGPGEETGDYVAALGVSDDVVDLVGRTKLPELLDTLKGATATVSNDTGPAHLSISLGTPTIVVVGGGHFGSFVPYPIEATPPNAQFVYEEMPCYHCFWRCHKRETKFDVFPCVSAVSVESVWDQLSDQLDE